MKELIFKPTALGRNIAIYTFILAQFVDFTFLKLGSVDISLQKVAVGALFPVSLFLLRRVYLPIRILLLGLFTVFCYSISFIGFPAILPEIISANFSVAIGVVGAIVLFTALRSSQDSISKLGKIWANIGLLSSLVTILQAIGILGFFTVSDEIALYRATINGLNRGVGFKFDPNFQALILVISLCFCLSYITKYRNIYVVITLLGILATFSRMGFIIGLLVLVLSSLLNINIDANIFKSLLKLLFYLLLLFLIVFALFNFGPTEIRDYIETRIIDIFNTLQSFNIWLPFSSYSQTRITSSDSRLMLVSMSLEVIKENWLFGIGPYQTTKYMEGLLGLANVSHNTFLELILIGGIWGVLVYFTYILFTYRALNKRITDLDLLRDKKAVILVSLAFFTMSFFLSLTYNSILWLPITLAVCVNSMANRLKKHQTTASI